MSRILVASIELSLVLIGPKRLASGRRYLARLAYTLFILGHVVRNQPCENKKVAKYCLGSCRLLFI